MKTNISLPIRSPEHALEDESKRKFRMAFKEPWFLVRDESGSDYGSDMTIEALTNKGKSPTNIRCSVQLKSTAGDAKKGIFSKSIPLSNVNYMVQSSCSFYCLYSHQTDELFYRSAIEVLQDARSLDRTVPRKTISVKFSRRIDQDLIQQIHAQMIEFSEFVSNAEQLIANNEVEEIVLEARSSRLSQSNIDPVFAYRLDDFGNMIRMEHQIWLMMHGELARGFEVFHKGHPLDNRRNNLAIRQIDPRIYNVEFFPTAAENSAARDVFRVIINEKPEKLERTQIPEMTTFWDVVRNLQKQGMSMRQEDVETYKNDCHSLLDMTG